MITCFFQLKMALLKVKCVAKLKELSSTFRISNNKKNETLEEEGELQKVR